MTHTWTQIDLTDNEKCVKFLDWAREHEIEWLLPENTDMLPKEYWGGYIIMARLTTFDMLRWV